MIVLLQESLLLGGQLLQDLAVLVPCRKRTLPDGARRPLGAAVAAAATLLQRCAHQQHGLDSVRANDLMLGHGEAGIAARTALLYDSEARL